MLACCDTAVKYSRERSPQSLDHRSLRSQKLADYMPNTCRRSKKLISVSGIRTGGVSSNTCFLPYSCLQARLVLAQLGTRSSTDLQRMSLNLLRNSSIISCKPVFRFYQASEGLCSAFQTLAVLHQGLSCVFTEATDSWPITCRTWSLVTSMS